MVRIEPIPMPDVQPCVCCGGTMTRGKRFERTVTVDVVVCWTCGAETPPMHRALAAVAPQPAPQPKPAPASYCRSCGIGYVPNDPRERYCSDGCRKLSERITLSRTTQRYRMAGRAL